MGQKQKTEKKKKDREKEIDKDWTMVITMAKLRIAHASTHGTRKPPGPKWIFDNEVKSLSSPSEWPLWRGPYRKTILIDSVTEEDIWMATKIYEIL